MFRAFHAKLHREYCINTILFSNLIQSLYNYLPHSIGGINILKTFYFYFSSRTLKSLIDNSAREGFNLILNELIGKLLHNKKPKVSGVVICLFKKLQSTQVTFMTSLLVCYMQQLGKVTTKL